MRPELLDPTRGDPRLPRAIALAAEIYRLHEAGRDYAPSLAALSALAERPISAFDVDSAFGSVRHETFARSLLVDWDHPPVDLTEAEMLELIERLLQPTGELLPAYWLACLKANTGDERISDLIFWPGQYFGDGGNRRELSAAEILATALRNRAHR